MRRVCGRGCRACGGYRQFPVFLVDLYDHRISAAVRSDCRGAGYGVRRRRRHLRLDFKSIRPADGLPYGMVLLGKFPAVDGFPGGHLSRDHRQDCGSGAQRLAHNSDRAGVHLDRRSHQLLPDFRQHLDLKCIRLPQAAAGGGYRRTGDLYGADKGRGQ